MGRKKKPGVNLKRLVPALLAIVFISIILYFIFRKKEVSPVFPTVTVETVSTRDMEIYGEYVGLIRAQQFVEIHARVEGYLEKMLFEEGTYVDKGQILFVIDPKLYKAKVDGAAAQLQKDRALALKAQRDLSRIKPLFEQNAASRLDLDNAIAAQESAAAAVTISEADLRQAEMALGYTQVVSPITGQISQRNVDIGTLVGPSSKSLLGTVVNSDTVRVDFSMTALDYLRSKERNVNIGHQDSSRGWNPYITVTLADNTAYPYSGFVDFADPQVNPQTGTFTVRARLPNPEHILLPGQYTKVKVLLDVHRDAVVVPSKAVIIEKGGTYIFVARPNGTVERRFIEIGPEVENSMVVERGLVKGEKIVVEGYHKLMPGIQVQIVEAEDPLPADSEEGVEKRDSTAVQEGNEKDMNGQPADTASHNKSL